MSEENYVVCSANQKQVYLTQLENIFLAVRADARFRSSFNLSSDQVSPFSDIEKMLTDIRTRLMVVNTDGASKMDDQISELSYVKNTYGFKHWSLKRGETNTNCNLARIANQTSGSEVSSESQCALMTSLLTEKEFLNVFQIICCSAETSETVTNVALSAMIVILEMDGSFLSSTGLSFIVDIVSNTKCEVSDTRAHEVLLYRTNTVLLACVKHLKAAEFSEDLYIHVLNRILVIYFDKSASPLLKRTAEKATSDLVRIFFQRSCNSSVSAQGRAGKRMLQFVSDMIRGDVVGFTTDRGPLRRDAPDGTPTFSYTSPIAPNGSRSFGSPSSASSPQKDAPSLGSSGQTVDLSDVPAIQLEGLNLAQCALFEISRSIEHETGMNEILYAVRNDMSRALLISGVASKHAVVLSQVLRTTHLIFDSFSEECVVQIYSFLRILHLDSISTINSEIKAMLESTKRKAAGYSSHHSSLSDLYQRQEVIIKSLVDFFSNAKFTLFIFNHFDLSWRFASVTSQILKFLASFFYSEKSRSDVERSSEANSEVYALGGNGPVVRNDLKAIAVCSIVNLLSNLSATRIDIEGSELLQTYTAVAQHVQRQKELLCSLSKYFDDSPLKKGIAFLLQNAVTVPKGTDIRKAVKEHRTWLVLEEPGGGKEIGACLYRLSSVLSKRTLGDYISELGKDDVHLKEGEDAANVLGTVSFHSSQLLGFIEQFNFAGKSLPDSTREMVYSLCLPGESQKIDRVMEAFANQWYTQNKDADATLNPFHSDSAAFILSFAIIMLNTDQHSSSVRNRMTFQEFVNMNRGIDEGKNLPEEYLRSVYDDIRTHEVIMAEMMYRGFANDISWNLEMRPTTWNVSDDLWSFLPHISEKRSEFANVSKDFFIRSFQEEFVSILQSALITSYSKLSSFKAIGNSAEAALSLAAGGDHYQLILFRNALEGLSASMSVAVSLQNNTLADLVFEKVSALLPDKKMDVVVKELQYNAPLVFVLRELVYYVPLAVHAHAKNCWSVISSLILELFRMGIFSSEELEALEGSVAITVHGRELNIPATFLRAPEFQFPVKTRAINVNIGSKSNSRAGGWISGFWGKQNNDAQSSQESIDRDTKELKSRLSIFPDIIGLLDVLMCLEDEPLYTCLSVWCKELSLKNTQVSFFASISYFCLLICTWFRTSLVLKTSQSVVSEFQKISCDYLLPYFESTLNTAFMIYEREPLPNSSVRNAEDENDVRCPLTIKERRMWKVHLERIVESVLLLSSSLLQDQNFLSIAIKWITLLEKAPNQSFGEVVGGTLCDFIYQFALQYKFQLGSNGSSPMEPMRNVLFRLTLGCCEPISPYTDYSSGMKIVGVLFYLVSHGFYDVLHETSFVANAALKLGRWHLSQTEEKKRSCQETLDADFVGTPVDIIRICCSNVSKAASSPEEAGSVEYFQELWKNSLNCLCAMLCVSYTPQTANSTFMAIQHALLEYTDMLSPEALLNLYNTVLFPLMECSCTSRTTDARNEKRTAMSETKPKIPIEVRCGVINLISKPILYTLTAPYLSNAATLELWRRLLGTYYAIFTSYTLKNQEDGKESTNEDDSISETIEETVKNTFYVASATISKLGLNEQQMKNFVHVLSSNIKPFPFSAALLSSTEQNPIVSDPLARKAEKNVVDSNPPEEQLDSMENNNNGNLL